jgi:hypothetical protein
MGRSRRGGVEIAVLGGRVLVRSALAGEDRRTHALSETGGVGSRLRAQLREVEIRAGLVADVHALAELALAVEAVKDDGVDGDGDGLDHDLDDAADERPFLQAADERVADVVFEEFAPLVVLAAPAPDVLAVAVVAAAVQHRGADGPHDNAEGEEEDGKDCVVDRGFFSALVTASGVGVEDADCED